MQKANIYDEVAKTLLQDDSIVEALNSGQQDPISIGKEIGKRLRASYTGATFTRLDEAERVRKAKPNADDFYVKQMKPAKFVILPKPPAMKEDKGVGKAKAAEPKMPDPKTTEHPKAEHSKK